MAQRYRVQGALTAAQTSYYNKDTSCSQTTYQRAGGSEIFGTGDKRIMSDFVVEGFHKKRAQGLTMWNPMSSTHVLANRVLGADFLYERPNQTINCSGQIRTAKIKNDPNHWESWYASVRGLTVTPGMACPVRDLIGHGLISALVVEHSTKVHNDRGRSDSNLWETLAEADKALGTLTGIFQSATRSMKSLAKKNLKGFTKESTGGYLGWRYGVKPLIQDTEAVWKGLGKAVGKERKTTRSVATELRNENRTLQFTHPDFNCTIAETATDSVVIRCMSLDEMNMSMANNIGLSTKGLLTLPWELVNKSFVIDWFLNIGDYIGSMVPAVGWTQLGSCVTIRRVQTIDLTPVITTPGNGVIITSSPSGSYNLTQTTFQRSIGLAQPSIVVRSDFRFENLTRCMDAYSLLAASLLGKKR